MGELLVQKMRLILE